MNKLTKLSGDLFVCLTFMLSTASLSYAQSAGDIFKDIGNNNHPIQIEADSVEILNDVYRATLETNVIVTQGETVLRANKVIVYYLPEDQRKQTSTGIREIIATGTVAIKSDDKYATGDRLEINFLTDTAILNGEAIILSQGANIVKGCELTIELTTGNSKFSGCRNIFLASPKTTKN